MADNPVMGVATCPLCGCKTATAKEMKSGAYIVCPPEHDGGCNQQTMGRSKTAAVGIARKVTKWTSPDMREKYLPKAAANDNRESANDNRPESVAAVVVVAEGPQQSAPPEPRKSILDMPILDVLAGRK